MRRIGLVNRRLGAAAFGLLLLLLGAVPALAQGSVSDIGVIDVQRIYRESDAAKALQGDIESQRAAYQKELQGQEHALRTKEQELLQQRAILSAEAFNNKRKELESQVAELQRALQQRRADLDQRLKAGLNQVRKVLIEVTRDITAERGISVVVDKSSVVLSKPTLEFTDQALTELNKRLPKIALPETGN